MDTGELSMFCRACLNETIEATSYPLDFTDSAVFGDESLRQLLERVMGFKLTNEMDAMPNRICHNCYNRLIQFYVFRTECLHSNDALQKYLNRTNLEQSVQSSDALYSIFEIKQEADAAGASAVGVDFDESCDKFVGADDYDLALHDTEADPPDKEFEIECYFGTGKSDEVYKCHNCNLRMHNVREMYSHLADHQPVRRDRTCQYCHRQFSNITPLRRHLAVHTDARPFKCSVCLKKYKRIDDLQAHFKVHK